VLMPDKGSIIRRATVADVEQLLTLNEQVLAHGGAREASIRARVSEGFCWVHLCHSRLDGYAVLLPHHFFARDFLELLFVRAACRRSGIATNLVRAMLRMDGTDQVFASTNHSNAPMRSLLIKEQWQLSGTLDGLDPGDPEMIFFAWRS
jgi:ribosomal protein S18 acetylase RimI-like enzyme